MSNLPPRNIGQRISDIADVSYARWAIDAGHAATDHVAAEGSE